MDRIIWIIWIKTFDSTPAFTVATRLCLMVFLQEMIYLEKKEAHINFNDKQSKQTHWISLIIDRNTAVYLDSFWIE